MTENKEALRYEKKALTFEAQANLLIQRGLLADHKELVKRLKAVSYYRLAGYLYPFRQPDSQAFKPNTQLHTVWDRYCFDRRLRVLLLDAIERIEVALRTQLVDLFVHDYGPFGYLDEANLPKLSVAEYLEWRATILRETQRSKEPFCKHFYAKYTAHKNLPLWMAAELMTMGSLLTFFKGVEPEFKRKLGEIYQVRDEVILSWLRSLNATRNTCAHHARLWNRTLGYPPLLPKRDERWQEIPKLPQDRCGIILLICRYMLKRISPTSHWHLRTQDLFKEYPEIPFQSMGLHQNWQNHPLWENP